MRHLTILLALALALATACGDDPKPQAPADEGMPDAGDEVDAADSEPDPAPEMDGGMPDTTPEEEVGCNFEAEEVDEIPVPEIYTPRWAFEPWISKDISDAEDTYAFVQGFIDRDIPVGVIVLDSPWETNYNTFIPNPDRYPDFDQLVTDMGDQDIRVVLWITQMINRISFDAEEGGDFYEGPAANFGEAQACGFSVNDGEDYFWWKGYGVGLDFFNPQAVTWWHRQQDRVLDAGIAGWKLDFGESYIDVDTIKTAEGVVPHQAYSEAYYRDFLAYGVHKRGPEDFVTMVRPYDESYQFEGRFFARPEHAPVAWVGDNRRDWVGFHDALDHIFRSAAAGYVVIGSDIGGYLDLNDKDFQETIPFNQGALDQWTAVGAMMPFMQLHGRANLTPWTAGEDPESFVPLYRYWSKLHQELVGFFYSLAQESYAGGTTIVRPIGQLEDWAGDYRFMVGNAFLVAPILDDTGFRDIPLPANTRWYDWWDPSGDPIEGGVTLAGYDASERLRTGLFVREGAIIPMNTTDSVTGIGDISLAGALTVLVYPGPLPSLFILHDEDKLTTAIETQPGEDSLEVRLSRATQPVALRVRAEAAPEQVLINGEPSSAHEDLEAWRTASEGWFYEAGIKALWVKTPASGAAVSVEIR